MHIYPAGKKKSCPIQSAFGDKPQKPKSFCRFHVEKYENEIKVDILNWQGYSNASFPKYYMILVNCLARWGSKSRRVTWRKINDDRGSYSYTFNIIPSRCIVKMRLWSIKLN